MSTTVGGKSAPRRSLRAAAGAVFGESLADAVLEERGERSLITVPTSVSGSSGSPAFRFFALASTRSTKVGHLVDDDDALDRRQRWPEFLVAPATATSAACRDRHPP